jgi:hypothetical protein
MMAEPTTAARMIAEPTIAAPTTEESMRRGRGARSGITHLVPTVRPLVQVPAISRLRTALMVR